MIEIGNTIVSLDILECKFVCDLKSCKGACCVEGDSGAPLEKEELKILETIYPVVKEYMSEEGKTAIAKQGTHIIDHDGDDVTPLNKGKECAYTIFEDKIAKCSIEKAYEDGKITFKKPISCHLYPIRVKKYTSFEGMNYDQWKICKPATILGKKKGIVLFQLLKEPLIRKYGEKWYDQLEIAAENLHTMR